VTRRAGIASGRPWPWLAILGLVQPSLPAAVAAGPAEPAAESRWAPSAEAGRAAAAIQIVELEVAPELTALLSGETAHLEVTAHLADGTRRDVGRECVFESSRSGIATVEAGLITAVAPGRAGIRVTHPSGKSARREPEVWVGRLVDIGVTPSVARIVPGETIPMRALAIHDNGRSRDMTDDVTWSSSDPSVLVVSDSAERRGLAVAVKPGRARATARSNRAAVESQRSTGLVEVTSARDGVPSRAPRR
jgi:hypothetical protein